MKRVIFHALILLSLVFPAIALGQVDPRVLSVETEAKIGQVHEFAYVRQLAEKYGVRAYLFGGTASSFAHYIRLDLERGAGNDAYVPAHFDYNLDNIYRSNQDFDIVLDANPVIAHLIMGELMKQFPYVLEDKSRWEIRLLRYPFGKSPALLGDYDFLNQHTDSNSIGLIELTQDDPDKQIYFDIRDLNNPESKFLDDIASGKITFHFSQTHETTSWAKKGSNPPILAAVRYLSKLTQHELVATNEDLFKVMEIISKTNFSNLDFYAQMRLKKFAIKALLNAPDRGYAWNLLDDVGLRQKLVEWDKHEIDVPDSLAWWMNRDPRRDIESEKGDGAATSGDGDNGIGIGTSNRVATYSDYDENATQYNKRAFASALYEAGPALKDTDYAWTRSTAALSRIQDSWRAILDGGLDQSPESFKYLVTAQPIVGETFATQEDVQKNFERALERVSTDPLVSASLLFAEHAQTFMDIPYGFILTGSPKNIVASYESDMLRTFTSMEIGTRTGLWDGGMWGTLNDPPESIKQEISNRTSAEMFQKFGLSTPATLIERTLHPLEGRPSFEMNEVLLANKPNEKVKAIAVFVLTDDVGRLGWSHEHFLYLEKVASSYGLPIIKIKRTTAESRGLRSHYVEPDQIEAREEIQEFLPEQAQSQPEVKESCAELLTQTP